MEESDLDGQPKAPKPKASNPKAPKTKAPKATAPKTPGSEVGQVVGTHNRTGTTCSMQSRTHFSCQHSHLELSLLSLYVAVHVVMMLCRTQKMGYKPQETLGWYSQVFAQAGVAYSIELTRPFPAEITMRMSILHEEAKKLGAVWVMISDVDHHWAVRLAAEAVPGLGMTAGQMHYVVGSPKGHCTRLPLAMQHCGLLSTTLSCHLVDHSHQLLQLPRMQ